MHPCISGGGGGGGNGVWGIWEEGRRGKRKKPILLLDIVRVTAFAGCLTAGWTLRHALRCLHTCITLVKSFVTFALYVKSNRTPGIQGNY